MTVLAAGEVPVIALKGAAFLDTLYALGERSMSDIDILIPAHLRALAHRELVAAGFCPLPPPRHRRYSHQHHYNWAYRYLSVCIEVHVDLAQPGRYRIDLGGLWDRSRLITTTSRSVRTLGPEDTLLYLTIHQAKHWLEPGTNDDRDLCRIIDCWHPDWDVVIARAHAWGARSTVAWSLWQAAGRGVPIPDPVLDALALGRWRRVGLGVLTRHRPTRWPWLRRGYQLATVAATTDHPADGARFLGRYAKKRLLDLSPRR